MGGTCRRIPAKSPAAMITFSPVPFLGDYTFGQGSGTFATWGLVDKIAGNRGIPSPDAAKVPEAPPTRFSRRRRSYLPIQGVRCPGHGCLRRVSAVLYTVLWQEPYLFCCQTPHVSAVSCDAEMNSSEQDFPLCRTNQWLGIDWRNCQPSRQ
jgi:hypothetical protein